jgi:hypothetical protein
MNRNTEPLVPGRFRSGLGFWIRLGFGMVGLAFMAVTFASSLEQVDRSLLPQWWQVLASLVLALGSLRFGFSAWQALLPNAHRGLLARGFYLSQLGKYIPGSIWQAISQIGYSLPAGVAAREAATALPVYVVVQLAAGGTVAASLFLGGEVDWSMRLLSLLGLLLVAMLHRSWMVRLVTKFGKSRLGLTIPAQRDIAKAYGRGVFAVACAGGAFAMLLVASDWHVFVPAVSAFGLAWTVGFLAVPFPAGLGVREGMLLLGLGGLTVPAVAVAVSVYHRVVTLVAEFLLIVATSGPETRSHNEHPHS